MKKLVRSIFILIRSTLSTAILPLSKPLTLLTLSTFLTLSFTVGKAQCPTGNVALETQAEVNAFVQNYPNCTQISGELRIGHPSIPSNITDLTPLQAITRITGELKILLNTNLATLQGLHHLTNVGGFLNIQVNGALANLDALSNLTQIRGLLLNSNTGLTSISGLQNIDPNSINSLYIGYNTNLAVCNLPNLCIYLSNPTKYGSISISGNKTNCLDEQAVTAACSSIVYIPDVNFKTYLLGISAINTNGDSEIQVSEAEAFTGTINCSSKNISNLTGIEAFINIKTLQCYANNLTTLDVSKNTLLTKLECYTNQITNLDISKNTALTDFLCTANKLTTLDVSKNTLLQKFYCNENQLTALDLSKNTALKDLRLQNNKLTNLNLKNGNNTIITAFNAKANTSLTCIQVDNPTYSASVSGWQKDGAASYNADCRPIVYIPDANFKNYLLSVSTINTNGDSEVQVEEAEAFTGRIDCNTLNIADLTGIEMFTKITQLFCFDNKLTSLDVSKNTALEYIYCQKNLLTSLDVSKNTALKGLYCYINLLTGLDISNNTMLTNLRCYANLLTSLNLKNGNNAAINYMYATANSLTCVQVDNVANAKSYTINGAWSIDAMESYNTNCYTILPVTLISFTAKADGNHAKLQWQTANEVGNKGFEIWRSGDDGVFVKTGKVQVSNFTSQIYSYTDKNPLNGINYYKLVQTDNDGTTTELGIRSLTFSVSSLEFYLYPNPTENVVNLSFTPGHFTYLQLSDVSGKVLQNIAIGHSDSSKQLSMKDYKTGIYTIKMRGKSKTVSHKIVKK